MIEIPLPSLNPELLEALLAEIVTRDGTDYGYDECSREDKIDAVRRKLESGEARLVWDAESETASLHKVVD